MSSSPLRRASPVGFTDWFWNSGAMKDAKNHLRKCASKKRIYEGLFIMGYAIVITIIMAG
jgi:hypothetical protein